MSEAGRLGLAKDKGVMLLVFGTAEIDAAVIPLRLVQADQIDVETARPFQIGCSKLDVPELLDVGDILDTAAAHSRPLCSKRQQRPSSTEKRSGCLATGC